MRSILVLCLVLSCGNYCFSQYFPERGEWEKQDPSVAGLDKEKLGNAIKFALDHEYSGSGDLKVAILKGFAHEPYHDILGPTRERGGPAGLVIKDGYIVAEWGDPSRVEMTFSVTKSYLSTVAGLALDHQIIANVEDKVVDYVWDGTFDGPHNSAIGWDHLLNQSSDWSGNLFGLEDWADRPPPGGTVDDWKLRELNTPGTVFEYNDVRVNVLAYSLLHVWRKPLPKVLKEYIMDPIEASTTWRWYGYDHAWTVVDGVKMQSVTGGGHSGGGVFVNTYDQARFGLLFLNNGNWNGQQLISRGWVESVQVPSKANESYGYMWWLNRGPRKWEEVDNESIYYAAGFGGNFIVIDKSRDLLIVTRWLETAEIGTMVKLVLESFDE